MVFEGVPMFWDVVAERIAVRPGDATGDDVRTKRAERLVEQYPGLKDDTVTSLLLSEAKELAKSKADGIKSLEAKAAAQVGLIGAGIGLLSFVGKSVGTLHFTAQLGAALALLFASILGNAISLWPARYSPPSIEVYNSLETCQNATLKAPVSLELTEAYLRYDRNLQAISIIKGRWQGVATVLFILGVLMLLLNFY
jgi:hypothetical protein